MIFSDWIGSIGVTILLTAFLLILINKISRNDLAYLVMNFVGSALAAVASYLIHYTPFIILELAWMFVSSFGIWKFYKEKFTKAESS